MVLPEPRLWTPQDGRHHKLALDNFGIHYHHGISYLMYAVIPLVAEDLVFTFETYNQKICVRETLCGKPTRWCVKKDGYGLRCVGGHPHTAECEAMVALHQRRVFYKDDKMTLLGFEELTSFLHRKLERNGVNVFEAAMASELLGSRLLEVHQAYKAVVVSPEDALDGLASWEMELLEPEVPALDDFVPMLLNNDSLENAGSLYRRLG